MKEAVITGKIKEKIFILRGRRVILDRDLAAIYGVSTSRFNEAVKRNRGRFPWDFVFRLTGREFSFLISQNAISKTGRGGRRALPYAFTEHGALMAANILRSRRAVQMSIFVVRAFIKMRECIMRGSETDRRFLEIERILLGHNDSIRDIYEKIAPLLLPSPEEPKKG